ncbi:MAG: DNA-directed RNA polymerase subunit beta' [Actinomycetia bacterium]|nr:DNA-directed RNA polymerase subunit beta' [Actinomycetes bacterium]
MPDVDVNSFDRLRIRLSSSDEIRSWSHGEVKKAETINYRSQKPEKDGLFCERIFGPTKDWECSCGKYRRPRYRGVKCERCGVEVTRAKVRRERMGHIELASPVAHVWYSQGVAKHMSTLLDVKYKDLEKVLYFVAPIITTIDVERREADYPDLAEELKASLEEYEREKAAELEQIADERDSALAWLLRDSDDIQALSLLTRGAEARSLKSTLKAVEKGEKGAGEKLEMMAASHGLAAKFPTAAAKLAALRAGELEIDATFLPYEELDTADRVRAIIRDSAERSTDIEDEYAERIEVRREAFDALQRLQVKQLFDDELVYREMYRLYGPQVANDGTVRDPGYFTGGMGAEHVRTLLGSTDFTALRSELRAQLREANIKLEDGASLPASVKKIVKRLSVVDAFVQSGIDPEWMVLDVIPVMPPELRPMVQLDGGRFATSDLNDLYRRVINRNNRLKKLLDLGAPEIIINNEKRMLQEAVDKLFDNRRDDRRQVKGTSGRPLKSLSHSLNGKQGRFRQNLLGKRVDYSGRSVIVGGPELKLHQCGLPKQMALELYKPFVMKRLVDRYKEGEERDEAPNTKAAKKLVERQRPVVWDVLEEVIADHPVLLNRAPTLHRLGIQAFEPVLVEGKAIHLHPLVCTAFNADFDGDQMAVHLPLSTEAQAEARVLMLSTNNIKSPANGRPLAVPSQDMVLGIYHLTTIVEGKPGEARAFLSDKEAVLAYDSRAELDLQARISVRMTRDQVVRSSAADRVGTLVSAGERIETSVGRILFNRAFPEEYPFINYSLDKGAIAAIIEDQALRYSTAETAEILDHIKDLGFHYATHSGITASLYDAMIPESKQKILDAYDKESLKIEEQYEAGLLTTAERHRQTIDIWNRATDEVGDAMVKAFDPKNPIFIMAQSGARGNLKQIRQLAGMRGLMQSPKGDVIDRPIKTNFREGLTVLEYFISTHGARKGLADTALGTETGGYTTRRFLDFVHDAIVRSEDCGTHEGVEVSLYAEHNGELDTNLIGRVVSESVKGLRGKVLLAADDYITSLEMLEAFEAAGIKTLRLRSALTCLEGRGICQKCYGYDLSNGAPVDIGTAVGVIAAQSIGEPGTQLTLRTFHTGGVAGTDITEGLPLVNEILESPKANRVFAILSEIDGEVSAIETDERGSVVVVTGPKRAQWRSAVVSNESRLIVSVGDKVCAGDPVTKGRPYGPDRLKIVGREKMLHWIINELQSVYRGQGVELNDKHFEIIAARMLSKVKVTDSGDSDFLVDSYVDRLQYLAENDRLVAEGKIAAQAHDTLIGPLQIVRASMRSLGSESFLSLASFMWTTTVLAQAAIESREDNLLGLKENVIIGKLIPAGTGMKHYRNVEVSYKGTSLAGETATSIEAAPDALRDDFTAIEAMKPEPAQWDVDPDEFVRTLSWNDEDLDADFDASKYLGVSFDPDVMLGGGNPTLSDDAGAVFSDLDDLLGSDPAGQTTADASVLSAEREAALLKTELAPDPLQLPLKEIGVSTRWATKFAEAGFSTVADLMGRSVDDLLDIPGIGVRAVEEVETGLKANKFPPLKD